MPAFLNVNFAARNLIEGAAMTHSLQSKDPPGDGREGFKWTRGEGRR